MTAELWRKVEDMFHDALSQPAETRSQWLRQSCGEDQELLENVEGMLQADGAKSVTLEREIRWAAASLLLTYFGGSQKR